MKTVSILFRVQPTSDGEVLSLVLGVRSLVCSVSNGT